MPIRDTPLDKITGADLAALIADGVREGRDIEYKRVWQIAGDPDKRELLADICSFANAGGGVILYGVEAGAGDQSGLPVAIPGLIGFDFDGELLRLQQIEKAWISPRLHGTEGRLVDLGGGKGVFIVRIRPGVRRPHAMRYGGSCRFYSRHQNGRYDLDVDELRRMFLESDSIRQRLQNFRLDRIDRIDRIVRRDVGAVLVDGAAVVLHIVPLNSLESFDFTTVRSVEMFDWLRPFGDYRGFSPPELNFEGCISEAQDGRGQTLGYVQVFNDGSLEAWSWRNVRPETGFFPYTYEAELRRSFSGYLKALKALDLSGPYFVAVTLFGAKGLGHTGHKPFREDIVQLPAQMMESGEVPIDSILRPIFNRAWAGGGRLHSPNYDATGAWIGPYRD